MHEYDAYRSCTPPPIPRFMNAVILHGRGFDNLSVTETSTPQVGDNQLLCRVDAAGVCTSILKIIAQGPEHSLLHGWDPEQHPLILGDEGSLTVVKTGKNLKNRFTIGQRCALQPAVDLRPIVHRKCYRNNAQNMHKCAVGYTLGGCLAQYLLIQEEVLEGGCLIPLPDNDLPYFAAALAEPISCVHSAQRRHIHCKCLNPVESEKITPGLLPGGITLIIGAGIMGRIHCEMAMRFNPRYLIITDKNTERLNQAKQSLQTIAKAKDIKFVTISADKLTEQLMHISKDKGADDVIVAVGLKSVQQQAFSLLKRGGVINLFGGLSAADRFLRIDSRQVHYDEIKIVGSSGGNSADLKAALQALYKQQIDPGNYVAAIASLDHVPHVLQLIKSNKINGRVIIYPHASVQKIIFVDYWDNKQEKKLLKNHLSKNKN
jgi:threonine dehydrogenase-like Zn-dependent dehydrogenase